MATATPNYGLRLPSDHPVTGDIVDVDADLNANFTVIDTELKRVDDIAIGLNNRIKYSVLTADDTLSNQTSYKTVASMTIGGVEANSIYRIDLFVLYRSSTVADFKFDINAPSGSTYFIPPAGIVPASVSSGGDIDLGVSENALSNIAGRGVAQDIAAIARGVIITAGTAGGVEFQYAQGTGEATTTTLRKGTWMYLHKLN